MRSLGQKGVAAIEGIGRQAMGFLSEVGLVAQFFVRIVTAMVRPPYRPRLLLQQAEFVGVGSMFIIVLTGVFTGDAELHRGCAGRCGTGPIRGCAGTASRDVDGRCVHPARARA